MPDHGRAAALGGDPGQGRGHPGQHLVPGLAVGDAAVEVAVDHPRPQHLCRLLAQRGVDLALAPADAHLRQLGQHGDRSVQHLRGLPGPHRPARVHPADPHLVGERRGLGPSALGQRRQRHHSGRAGEDVLRLRMPETQDLHCASMGRWARRTTITTTG